MTHARGGSFDFAAGRGGHLRFARPPPRSSVPDSFGPGRSADQFHPGAAVGSIGSRSCLAHFFAAAVVCAGLEHALAGVLEPAPLDFPARFRVGPFHRDRRRRRRERLAGNGLGDGFCARRDRFPSRCGGGQRRGATTGTTEADCWTHARGVVSLAAGMALPVATDTHPGFPHRDLILFLTFMVILGTLVGQGLTLGPLIRRLGVHAERAEEKHEAAIRVSLAKAAQAQLDRVAGEGGLPPAAIAALRLEYENPIRHLSDEQAQVLGWSSQREEWVALRRLRREALKAERSKLVELHQSGKTPQELRYQFERELDLEEPKLG